MSDTNVNQDLNQPPEGEPAAPEGEPKLIPETRLNNVLEQLAADRKRLAEMESAEQARQAEIKKQEEAEAIKRQEFDKVIKDKEQSLLERDTEINRLKMEAKRSKLDMLLSDEGCKDPDARLGKISRYFAMGEDVPDMAEWIKAEKSAKPESFEASTTPGKPATAGVVGGDNGMTPSQDLDKRLASPDLYIRSEALAEKRRLREAGKA